ncbi:loricrin [Bactrocera oleae]|uniref:loricrin n=1 Tax=Bactrocera oleae TaxID=104688 RepID=UPI00387EC77A
MKFFVFYGAAVVLLVVNACASASSKAEPRISVAVKPKREASLSSGYHGPSYKYLPPAPASVGINAGGYNTYSSHGSSSAGFGASGSSGLGYDFGHSSAPKVETYIVQTEPTHSVHSSGSTGYSSGSSSSHHYNAHGSASVGGGYRYSNSAPHFAAGGASLLGYSGVSGGGNYKYHTRARPHVQTLIIPANTLTHGASGGSSASHGIGFGGAHVLHSSSGSFGNGGYQYAPTFGSSLHSSAGSGFGGAHGSAFAGSHGSGGATFGGHSSGSLGAHGGNSVTYNSQQGYSYNSNDAISGAAVALGHSAHGGQLGHGGSGGATVSFNNQDGYSNQEYAHSAPSIPSTNYGVPAGPAVSSYHGAADAGNSYHSSADETPAYAVGHKGLGYFSFSASKPHALNTNFNSAGSSGHSEHSGRAPFKPSTLLGTTYEVSGPAAQYLPPTSPGYEYQSHTVLQGGAAGAAAGHINEPNSAYLPPVSTPGGSYLSPHH